MGALVYIRLIGYTAGTLLQLFWMVVILGYRRQRNFERVFFFLCLALFLFYSGSLLALNAQIYYTIPPLALQTFALTLLSVGLCFLPALLIHIHIEYADVREMLVRGPMWKHIVLVAVYSPALFFGLRVYSLLTGGQGFDFLQPGNTLGKGYGIWLSIACGASSGWEFRFALKTRDKPERTFHIFVGLLLAMATILVVWLHVLGRPISAESASIGSTVLSLIAILPLTVLIYLVQNHNFLQIGRQKNLLYAISATFLALLYLSLVRRVGVWLEPILPPEASASVLLFVLVVFIEPFQRALGRRLKETAQREMDRVQRLSNDIQIEARQGELRRLIRFIERSVKEQLEFEEVWLSVIEPSLGASFVRIESEDADENFSVSQPGRLNAVLTVKPYGAMLSGEARAALELLCTQMPNSIELCRLIEEKLLLERELAERERLAVLGQMAASISHNLKNPLGSIKTILQVQMENPELPQRVRGETKMVLEEIGRLSSKLNQLLQFSRPAVLGNGSVAKCDAAEVARQVEGVLQHDAQRKGITLELNSGDTPLHVAVATEAVNDILTNLVVNALDAAPRGGHVRIEIMRQDGRGLLAVQDDGPGVPAALREKIMQPFFTTKAQGTGLGLAIVARRAADAGGNLELESPVKDGLGTRFLVWLPLGEEKR